MDKDGAPIQTGNQMALLFIGRTIAFGVTFAVPLVLARVFSQDGFGLYKQLFLIHATLTSILTFGFSSSLFYFLPRQTEHRHAYISQTLFALTGLALVGALGLIAFKAPLARALNNPELEAYIPYLAAFTVLSLVTSFLESLMIILKQVRLAAATSLASEMVRAGLMLGAALLTQSMLVLVLAALAWAACRLAALFVYLRKMGMPLRTTLQRERLDEQIRYALPFGVAMIVGTFATNLHQYIVSNLYTPALFAIYSVGFMQIPIVAIAFESVSDVTLVRLTELRHKGMLGEASQLLGDSVTKLFLFLMPLTFWLMASADDVIVLLYTEQYHASIAIFRIFLLDIPLAALALDYVPRAFADTGFILRMNLVLLVLSGVFLVMMAPLGLGAAALASVIAYAITKGLILVKVKNLLEISFRAVLPWRRLGLIAAAAMTAGAAAWLVHLVGALGPAARVCVSGVVFVCVYGMLLWSLNLLGAGERGAEEWLKAALAGAWWKSRRQPVERMTP